MAIVNLVGRSRDIGRQKKRHIDFGGLSMSREKDMVK